MSGMRAAATKSLPYALMLPIFLVTRTGACRPYEKSRYDLGLLDDIPDASKDIGLLMGQALEKIAFMPFRPVDGKMALAGVFRRADAGDP